MEIIFGLLGLLLAYLLLSSAVFDNGFMNTRRARFLQLLLTRMGVRILYGVMGAAVGFLSFVWIINGILDLIG